MKRFAQTSLGGNLYLGRNLVENLPDGTFPNSLILDRLTFIFEQ